MPDTFKLHIRNNYDSTIRSIPDGSPVRISPQQFMNAGFPTSLTGKGVKVCVIDTGNVEHRSIKISTSMANMGRSKVARDSDGHAHAVAGIIGACDLHHLVGLAPDSIIACVKATDDVGAATADSIAAAIIWAVVAGMDVLVLSHSINFRSKLVAMALEKAEACQAVIVAPDGIGEVPEHILQASTFPLIFNQHLVTLAPDDKYITVPATDFGPAIVAGIVAAIMEKGLTLREGQHRSLIMKQTLINLLSRPAK